MNARIDRNASRLIFGGCDDVYHNAEAAAVLPDIIRTRDYRRVFIISSRTINRKTPVVRVIEKSMDGFVVGLTDEVGEHAPLENVIKAAKAVRDARADAILAIGGGSVLDLAKVVALCITEKAFTCETLLAIQSKIDVAQKQITTSTYHWPEIPIIAIPTTMATAEWTFGATPMDEQSRLKARYNFFGAGPRIIIYDPEIVAQTPRRLLFATAVRGLDHAINTRCAVEPHPMASPIAEQAVKLFIENLPRLKANLSDRVAMTNCQLATSFSGITMAATIHGFSHWMVHVIGPYAGVGHSEAACILMLAQARWLEGYANEEHRALKRLLNREQEPLHKILKELLDRLEMPTTFQDIGVTSEQLDEMAPLALDHPLATKHNIRPIISAKDVRAVLELGVR
jgi:maleylacetate reductase